jgi:hypothetical protein
MSYKGGIDFISVEGGTVDWKHVKLEPRRKRDSGDGKFAYPSPRTLVVVSREFRAEVHPYYGADKGVCEITFDSPGGTAGNPRELRCVVVGSENGEPIGGDEGGRVNFVLIVKPAGISERGAGAVRNLKAYKRIGAGSIPGRCILDGEGDGEEIAVV